MERYKRYITLADFLQYKEKGQVYEGYVIGYGYAFYEALAIQMPYQSYNPSVPPSYTLSNYQMGWQQNLDTTPEAIMQSFGKNSEYLYQQLIREQNGESYINMGHGEILRIPTEGSSISIDMNSSGKLKLSVKSVSGGNSIEKSVEIDLEAFNAVFNNPDDVGYLSLDSHHSRIEHDQSQGRDSDNWWTNAMTAARMFREWNLGMGPANRTFTNDRVANAFRNAYRVNQARDFWYKEAVSGRNMIVNPVTAFRGDFGLSGLFRSWH